MDNQNNPNNQNQQNGYTDFNNYQSANGQNVQPPVQPQQGQPVPPQQGQPLPYQTYQTQPVVREKDNSTTMGVLSLVFGLVSLFVCPYILGAAGVGCGIAGLSKKKGSKLCLAGLIVSIIALLINIVWTVYSAMHPEIQQQMLNNLFGGSVILFR